MFGSQESRRRNEAGEERGVDEEETEMEEAVWPASLLLFSMEAEDDAAQRAGSCCGRLGYPPPEPPSPALILPGNSHTSTHRGFSVHVFIWSGRQEMSSGLKTTIPTWCYCDGQIPLKSPVSS